MANHHWHGEEEEFQKAFDRKLALRFFGLLLAHKKRLIIVVIVTILAILPGLIAPLFLKIAIDNCIKPARSAGEELRSHYIWLLAAVGAARLLNLLAGWLLRYWQAKRIFTLGQEVVNDLRMRLFSHLQRLSLSYFDRTKEGYIIARATSDIDAVGEVLTRAASWLLEIVFFFFGAIFIMLFLNWRLFLSVIIIVPLLAFITTFFRPLLTTAYREVRKQISRLTANLTENIAGVREVQSFTREEYNLARFNEINEQNYAANVRAAKIYAGYMPMVGMLRAIGTCIILLFGGWQVYRGTNSIGNLVAVRTYVQYLFGPIEAMGELYNWILRCLAAAERIFSLLDTQPETRDLPEAITLPQIEGRVTFRNVTFSYDGTSEVLKDINLEALPGQTVALVGPTGAGKTSIVNLLARFYEPQRGSILVDGYDIKRATLKSLHQQMGIVLQDSFLFSGTVMENIRYGLLEATDEEVEAAARTIGSHPFIQELRDGYQTQVGERGASLSQGERQLICLTRALLADPGILILDEATSAIDLHTEAMLQRAVAQVVAGRTSFVVAHRLSTVRGADKIVVVKDGRIVEQGTPQELLARAGDYAQMYREFIGH